MRVFKAKSEAKLSTIWFIGSGALLLLLTFQTIFGHYADKANEAWAWLLPNIIPTLSLIVGVWIADILRKNPEFRTVDRFIFRISLFLSILYILCVGLIVLLSPFSDLPPLRLMQLSSLWLGPFQGLVCAVIGLFFVSRQPTFQTKLPISSNLFVNTNRQKIIERPIKILFLAANPKDTERICLDEEMRGIENALRQAEFRDKFEIKQHWAVRVFEIQGYFLRHKPDIVHFTGHGSASNEIILEDNKGNSRTVSTRALSQLFSVLKDNIRCVVLNACYSESQAQTIAKYIDCVIGMSKAIGDSSAISFASSFYQAIGFGRDVKTAFELGCGQIDLEGLNEQDTPKLIAINKKPDEIVFVQNG